MVSKEWSRSNVSGEKFVIICVYCYWYWEKVD